MADNGLVFDIMGIANRFFHNINLGNVAEGFEKKVKEETERLQRVNILVAGCTGVGKSTLINAAFRDNLAETGVGDPVTDHIDLITKKDVPLGIYDTRGLELDKDAQKKAIRDIKDLIKDNQKKGIGERIHLVWYCVSAGSKRFQSVEENLLKDIANYNVPAVLVLTQVFDAKSAAEFKSILENKNLPIKKVIPVLAMDMPGCKAFGVDDMVEYSVGLLPEEIRPSFINAVKANKLKRERAQKIVWGTVAGNFAIGFIPIPFSDAILLGATEMAMLGSIAAAYGLNIKKDDLIGILTPLAGVGAAQAGGKAIVGGVAKLIPGVGIVVGGVISGVTAAILTFALGNAFIALMDMVAIGKIDASKIRSIEAINALKKAYKENLKIGAKKFEKGLPAPEAPPNGGM